MRDGGANNSSGNLPLVKPNLRVSMPACLLRFLCYRPILLSAFFIKPLVMIYRTEIIGIRSIGRFKKVQTCNVANAPSASSIPTLLPLGICDAARQSSEKQADYYSIPIKSNMFNNNSICTYDGLEIWPFRTLFSVIRNSVSVMINSS